MEHFGQRIHLFVGAPPRCGLEKFCHFGLPALVDVGNGHLFDRAKMSIMKLYKLQRGAGVEIARSFYRLPTEDWDALLNHDDLPRYLATAIKKIRPTTLVAATPSDIAAPISQQEVWAAGVTYHRSRNARREESKDAGGGTFYDRVYTAKRPELFFKANPPSVSGHGEPIRIRRDSKWNVPEPELVAAVNTRGQIIGYTIGNDVSSRDIEGENPLYLSLIHI